MEGGDVANRASSRLLSDQTRATYVELREIQKSSVGLATDEAMAWRVAN